MDILRNLKLTELESKRTLFRGDLILYENVPSVHEFVEHASFHVRKEFQVDNIRDTEFVQSEDLYKKIYFFKQKFSHLKETKAFVGKIIQSFQYNTNQNIFDVPRMRIVTSTGHLIPAAKPAYSIHRDTWYANPESQVNWWLPLHNVESHETFGFYPDYYNKPVENLSNEFNFKHWYENGGFQTFNKDTDQNKKFPFITEKYDQSNEIRIPCKKGDILLFAAHHLHGTLPNTSSSTRLSIDFRTVNLCDLENKIQSPNVDNFSKSSIMMDMYWVHTLEKYKDYTG